MSHKENQGEKKQGMTWLLWVNKNKFWIFAGKKALSPSLSNEESKKLCLQPILENNEVKFEEYTVPVVVKLHHIQRAGKRVMHCVECVQVLWVGGTIVI